MTREANDVIYMISITLLSVLIRSYPSQISEKSVVLPMGTIRSIPEGFVVFMKSTSSD